MPMEESNVFHFSVLWCGGGFLFLELDGVAVDVDVDDVAPAPQPASNWFACLEAGCVVVGVLDVSEVPRRREIDAMF